MTQVNFNLSEKEDEIINKFKKELNLSKIEVIKYAIRELENGC